MHFTDLSETHRPVETVYRLLQRGQGPGRDLERGRCLVEVACSGLVSLRGRDSVELRGHPRQRDQHLTRARSRAARDLKSIFPTLLDDSSPDVSSPDNNSPDDISPDYTYAVVLVS